MSVRVKVVTNVATGVFQSAVIRGVRERLAPQGAEVSVLELPVPPTDAADLPPLGDGAIVLANALPDVVLAAIKAAGTAVTLVSHLAPGLGLPSVLHDNRQGMGQLAELLASRGVRSPAFIRGNLEQLDGRERERFLRLELLRRGLELRDDHLLEGGFEVGIAGRAVAGFLASGPNCDAIVGADYLMALEALGALRAAGVDVPNEMSLVAFGDGPEAETAGLTVVAADVVELGRRAARQLLAQLGAMRLRGYTLLSTRLVSRAT